MVLSSPGEGAAAPIVESGAGEARFREIDGLRGIAALAVVLYHFTDYLGPEYGEAPQVVPNIWWGEYGVQLFFLISGFVILLSARRSRRPSDFLISRASRLYPVYWIAVTMSILMSVAFRLPGTDIGWVDRIMNYTMVQRLLLFDNVDPVYWTLAVEMQFYALIFLVLVSTRGRITDRVAIGIAFSWITVSVVLGLLARPHTLGVDPQSVDAAWKIVLNLLLVEYGPLFAAGMMCFIARRSRSHLPLAIGALVAAPVVAWIVRGADHASMTALVATIFALVALRKRTRILRWEPVQFFGRISYSLYVGHLLAGTAVIIALTPVIGRDLSIVAALVTVTGIAVVYNRVGEQLLSRGMKIALTRLRDRASSAPGPDMASSEAVSR